MTIKAKYLIIGDWCQSKVSLVFHNLSMDIKVWDYLQPVKAT